MSGCKRRLHQDEVAIAGHQEILDLPVALAGGDLLAHQMAQIGGQRRVGFVDAFALADETAQLPLQLAGARFHCGIGKLSATGAAKAAVKQHGKRRNRRQNDAFIRAGAAAGAGVRLGLTRKRPHRLDMPPSAITSAAQPDERRQRLTHRRARSQRPPPRSSPSAR